MIGLNAPASIWCDQPGCVAVQPARLVLKAGGGWGAIPQNKAWEVLVATNGTLLARCPEHATTNEKPALKRKRVAK